MFKKMLFWGFVLAPLLGLSSCTAPGPSCAQTPSMYPDYSFCRLPYNIAPCNFYLNPLAQAYRLEVYREGQKIYSQRGRRLVQFPLRKWHRWLEKAKGDTLWLALEIKQQGQWRAYKPFPLLIDSSPIAPYLTYRLIEPSYQLCSYLVIEERNLENFKTRNLFDNLMNEMACVNCHTSAWGDPNYSVYHVRFKRNGTYIACQGNLKRVDLTSNRFPQGGVYPAWHPSKRYIAFGTAQAFPFVHSKDIVRRTEVFDSLGDIFVYDLLQNRILSDARICSAPKEETFPAFDPSGKTLYFCQSLSPAQDSASEDPVDYSKKIHYNLMSIEFNAQNGQFGKMQTLVNADSLGQTVSFPRISANGKYLVFCLSHHGTFPIRHPESDLYIMDLESKQYAPLEGANSPKTESYHEWSPQGSWLMFSSKREDGMYSRPYFCKIEKGGRASKPFLLPQKDPAFYLTFLKSFNVPVFSLAPAPYGVKESTQACETEIQYPAQILIQP